MPQGVLDNADCKTKLAGSHAALVKTTIDLADKDSTELDTNVKCISLSNHTLQLTNQSSAQNLAIHYNSNGTFENAGMMLKYS